MKIETAYLYRICSQKHLISRKNGEKTSPILESTFTKYGLYSGSQRKRKGLGDFGKSDCLNRSSYAKTWELG